MNKRKRADVLLVLCGVLVWFLADAQRIRAAAAQGLLLCGSVVIPSLFPFLVVSRLLIALGFGEWLSPLLSGFMTPLFRLPGLSGSALVLGLVGGYPIGAQTAVALYKNRLLTRQEAQRLLAFCNNANPVFFISVLGSGVFGSTRTGLWLWLIHLLSALLVGLCFRGHGDARGGQRTAGIAPVPSFPTAFLTSVQGAAEGMLSICAFVTLFYTIASTLSELGGTLGSFLVGLLELFSLTPLLAPDASSFILASFCAGWGGLSVLCQTAAALENTDLSFRSCVWGKALQACFSGLLAAALVPYALS